MRPHDLARLDKKTELKVLCARDSCGNQVAKIEATPLGRALFFPQGVALRPDGTWGLTKHAAAGLAYGRRPAFRRKPQLKEWKALSAGEINEMDLWEREPTPHAYPAVVQCWQCRLIQQFETDALRVVLLEPGTRVGRWYDINRRMISPDRLHDETHTSEGHPKKPTVLHHACGQKQYWQIPDGRWLCAVCYPPDQHRKFVEPFSRTTEEVLEGEILDLDDLND